MLYKVKQALRITSNALDAEIEGLIAAAKADLRLSGIVSPDLNKKCPIGDAHDPLIERAIILYAKANFGYDEGQEKYREAFEYQKCALALSSSYKRKCRGKT
jgi:hypothetical protein